jgi:hypothetical protein
MAILKLRQAGRRIAKKSTVRDAKKERINRELMP